MQGVDEMTEYELISKQMIFDLAELRQMVFKNGGEISGKYLATKYRSDASACKCILLGILAMEDYIRNQNY